MIFSLILASAVAAGASAPPSVTCIKTTIKANGHTSDNSVAETSGSRDADRYALQIIRMFNLERSRGEKAESVTGYVLVETYPNGTFGMSILDLKGQVLPSCDRPGSASGT
jgi:hypothetical protein